MINSSSIFLCSVSVFLLLIFYLGVYVFFSKKYKIRFIPVLCGFLLFILFALILEPIIHQLVLQPSPNGTISMKTNNPIVYMMYAAFTAGVFEEIGRYTGLAFLSKKYPEQNTSIAYGLGHGGAELLILGVGTLINNLILMISINQNNKQVIINLPKNIVDTLINTPSSHYLFILIERIPALFIQILLTIIVWYGIKHSNSLKILPLAIVLHAVIDLISAAYQVGYIQNFLVLYGLLYLATLGLFVLTKKYFFADYDSLTKKRR